MCSYLNVELSVVSEPICSTFCSHVLSPWLQWSETISWEFVGESFAREFNENPFLRSCAEGNLLLWEAFKCYVFKNCSQNSGEPTFNAWRHNGVPQKHNSSCPSHMGALMPFLLICYFQWETEDRSGVYVLILMDVAVLLRKLSALEGFSFLQ